jgi:hypothetical protein
MGFTNTINPPGANVRTFTVTYVGQGNEGTDINVPIGCTMYDASYVVVPATAGGTSGDGTQSSGVQALDLPMSGRTTTTFRTVFGRQPALGDVFQFLVSGLAAL